MVANIRPSKVFVTITAINLTVHALTVPACISGKKSIGLIASRLFGQTLSSSYVYLHPSVEFHDIIFVMPHPSDFLSDPMPQPRLYQLRRSKHPYVHIYKSRHLPSLIFTARANCGKIPLKLGPSDQLFRSRRCVSKAGLMSHWSSSLGTPVLSGRLTGVPAACGVCGPAGLPLLTCVENGEDGWMEDELAERVFAWIFEAGRRTSRGS